MRFIPLTELKTSSQNKSTQVWDRERVIIIPDHYIFTSDPRANRNVDILREFVQEQNIK